LFYPFFKVFSSYILLLDTIIAKVYKFFFFFKPDWRKTAKKAGSGNFGKACAADMI
jgi:hypothetical protein